MHVAMDIVFFAFLVAAIAIVLKTNSIRSVATPRILLLEALVWTMLTWGVNHFDWSLSNIEIVLIETGYFTALILIYFIFLVSIHNYRMDTILQRSESEYRLLTETVDIMVFRLEYDGTISSANPVFSEMLKLCATDLTGKKLSDFVTPEDARMVEQRVNNSFENGVSDEFNVTLILRDGQNRKITVRIEPLIIDGQTVQMMAYSRDLTEQYRAVNQATFLSTIITESNLPILIVGDDNSIIVWSKGMETLTGIKRQDANARSYEDLLFDIPDLVLECAAGQGSFTTELQLKIGEGTIPVLLTANQVDLSENDVAYAVYFQDLTRQRKLEEQLLHQQRLDALGKLAGGVAHDFNNVLTIISGNAAILRKHAQLDEKYQPHLDGIIRSTRRGASLTQQLLNFSKRLPFTPRRMDAEALIGETVDLISHAGWNGIHFDVSVEPGVPPILVDTGRMQQVLMNLCVNARDAMPRGGTIRLSAQARTLLNAKELPKGMRAVPGQYVVIGVKDTGVGMDPSLMDRIFEPFFTTKGPSKGTGLGLANVYGIVQQHRGWIEVDSAPGKGSTFQVILPTAETFEGRSNEVEKRQKESKKAKPPQSVKEEFFLPQGDADIPAAQLYGNETILFVDDESLVREVGKTALELYGYKVLTASDGQEAMTVYEAHKEEIDVVVLDWAMRDVGGQDMLDYLRKKGETVPVLIQSGVWNNSQRDELIQQGANGLLTKPYMPDKLVEEIRNLIKA